MLQRYDEYKIQAKYDSNGFLRDTPIVGRVGLLYYRNADGSTRTEYRRPEEAFNQDSLDSLNGVPVLIEHHGLVTGNNFTAKKNSTVGTVLTSGKQDGSNIRADVVIHQKLTTPNREISCGYTCDNVKNDEGFTDPTTGVTPDYFQTNIRYNHISLVRAGRAGSVARLNMDGAQVIEDEAEPRDNQLHEDAVLNTAARKKLSTEQFGLPDTREYPMPDREHAGNAKARASQMLKEGKLTQAEYEQILAKANKILKGGTSRMDKLKLDSGLEYEAAPEVVVAYNALKAKQDATDAALATTVAKLDACMAKAKKDGEDATAALDALKAKQDEAIQSRIKILTVAKERGIEKADAMTDSQIKTAVIGQSLPSVKLDGLDEAHVAAYYDVALGMKQDAAHKQNIASRREQIAGIKQDENAAGQSAHQTTAQLYAKMKQDEADLYLKEAK